MTHLQKLLGGALGHDASFSMRPPERKPCVRASSLIFPIFRYVLSIYAPKPWKMCDRSFLMYFLSVLTAFLEFCKYYFDV